MNLQKAIEINQSLLDGTYDHRDELMETALNLGIEALKAQQLFRKRYPRSPIKLLPGETED